MVGVCSPLLSLTVALIAAMLGSASGAVVGLPDFPILRKPPEFEVWIPGDPDANVTFPLQGTEVEAVVANGVVHARVAQVYRNDGPSCLQSRYIFPLPHRAAVSSMRMEIGGRTVIGDIRTREDAKNEFDQAQQAGQQASLLDQERPNVFAMSLANILPGETTRVVIEYQETLSPTDGVFAFIFPAVVGPRYGKGWEPGADTSNLTVDLNLTVSPTVLGFESNSSLDISDVVGSSRAVASGVNADLVVKFWYTDTAVAAQFLLSQRGDEKYFSLAIQPPQRRLLSDAQVSKREYLFILDVSGSMTGFPMDLSKSLMTKLLQENVRTGDSFNILLFAGGQAVLNETGNVDATSESIEASLRWLDDNMHAGGGTELLPALRKAFSLPRSNPAASRTLVVMTDGYVTVERQAFDLVRDSLGDGNVFVFGIGQGVNRYIVDGLARVGYGEPFVVASKEQGEEVADRLRLYIDTPVLTRLRLAFDGPFSPHDAEPPALPDVFASRPVQVVGKYTGPLEGNVTLKGLLADGSEWVYSASLEGMATSDVDAVPLLWARSRIAVLSDYAHTEDGDSNKGAITELGLNFSLMTEHTSFIAVDSAASAPDACPTSTTTTSPGAGFADGLTDVAMSPSIHFKHGGVNGESTNPMSRAVGLLGGSSLRLATYFLLAVQLLAVTS